MRAVQLCFNKICQFLAEVPAIAGCRV